METTATQIQKLSKEFDYKEVKAKLKKAEWINGNKMKFESEHKTFNRQTNCISTGNIISNTILGLFVRNWNNTECNGKTDYEAGHLYKFDTKNLDLPSYVESYLRKLAKNTDLSFIVYQVRHYNANNKIIHGWIITDNNFRHIRNFYTNNSYKSDSIMSEVMQYVSWKDSELYDGIKEALK